MVKDLFSKVYQDTLAGAPMPRVTPPARVPRKTKSQSPPNEPVIYLPGNRLTYFIQAGENGAIKIGSSKSPLRRLGDLQVANSEKLTLLAVTACISEKDAHTMFRAAHIEGEWFIPSLELLNFIFNCCQEEEKK